MQETEQGLVALTAYSLQPWLASRAPERSSVQLLASCINKGDLSGLHSLRWEPPADSSPVPASEGAQKLPAAESIIHIPPLDPGMGMGHLRGPGATPCAPQATGKAVSLAGEEKQENRCTGQRGMEALGKSEGAMTTPPGPRFPDLQITMQSRKTATAEAQSLQQQARSKHKPGPTPGAASMPTQDGLLQAPATGTAQSNSRPLAGGNPRIPAAPGKVSGEQKALPGGLPGGWVTIQDGIYTARPVRTFDLPRGVRPSEQGPLPLLEGPGQSLGPGQDEPGGQTQKAWGPPEKVTAGLSPGGLQAAETTLQVAPLAHHTQASGPRAAGANLHSRNASVPPPPPLPAAVTGPDFPAQPRHDENSIRQASKPTQDPLYSHSSPAGQKSPGESQTKTLKPEPPTHLRKKPQLPPKPAHLSQLPLPRWLSKPSALAHSATVEAGPGKYKQGETASADHDPQPNKVSTAADQGRVPLPQGPAGQSQPSPQHGPSTVAPRPTKSQATGSNHHSPDPLGVSALSSHPISLQQGPSLPGEKCTDASQQGAPESPEILQGGQQELQGLLSQVQALEKEAESTVDVRALRRLFEAVPQLPGAPPAPATPRKPEASVEQAFGELTRVSTEVARLKEQTLARLLDIEEAVHKALSSMSSLQPGSNTRGHSQGPPREHSAHSGQEVQSQTPVKSQTEVQSQAKVRNHSEARSQAALATPPTRRLETLREDSRLPQGLPLSRESLSSPTVISMESATRKLPEAASPRGNPEISMKRVHFTQDECQTQPHQKDIWHEAGEKEAPQLSGPPPPGPAADSALPTRQKNALELQTAPGGSQHYGATGTVAERVDRSGTTALTSPTTVTEPAEPPRGPGAHLGCHTSPLMRQFLHSPSGLSTGLAEAEMLRMPCGHPTPAAQ